MAFYANRWHCFCRWGYGNEYIRFVFCSCMLKCWIANKWLIFFDCLCCNLWLPTKISRISGKHRWFSLCVNQCDRLAVYTVRFYVMCWLQLLGLLLPLSEESFLQGKRWAEIMQSSTLSLLWREDSRCRTHICLRINRVRCVWDDRFKAMHFLCRGLVFAVLNSCSERLKKAKWRGLNGIY